jgi:protein O-GlcNAc transferase
MNASTIENWKSKATLGKWEELLKDTLDVNDVPASTTTIWRVKALRALAKGDEANKELHEATKGILECELHTALEIAEELIQCAMFNQAMPLIKTITESGHPAGYFLSAALLREQSKFDEAIQEIHKLKSHGDSWCGLAQLSEAWIRIKQGWISRAEECLQPFLSDKSLATQKLIARFEIATGQVNEALVRLQAVALKQPLDWEWPHLLATVKAILGHDLKECLELIDQGLSRQPRQAEALALLSNIRTVLGDEVAAKNAMLRALLIKPWHDGAVTHLINNLVSKGNFKEAVTLLEQAKKLANTPRRQAISLDLMRLTHKKKREVAGTAVALAEKCQDDPEVLRSCAAALLATGRRDAAAKQLERVLFLNPYDKKAKNNLAILYKERGDLEDAITLLRLMVIDGDQVGKINLAQILVGRGEYLEGEQLWNEIEKDGSALQSVIERGRSELSFKRGEIQNALRHAIKACELEANNSQNWLIRAQIESLLSGSKKAAEILQAVENSVDQPIRIRQELLIQWKRLLIPREILKKIRVWRDLNKEDSEYCLMEASISTDVADYVSAELALKEAVKRDETTGTVELIRFLMQRGKFEPAILLAEEWVKKDPKDIRRWAQLAEIYFFENSPESALKAVEQALKLEPNRASLVRQKVGILLNQQRNEEAELSAKVLWEKNNEYSALAMWLRTVERQGEYERALNIVKELSAIRPQDQMLRARFARQLSLLGDLEKSTEILFELHKDTPDSDVHVKNLVQSLMRLHRKDEALKTIKNFSLRQSSRFDIQVAIASLALDQGLLEEARLILSDVRKQSTDMIDAWIGAAMVERRAELIEEEKEIWLNIALKFHPSRWINASIDHWLRLKLESKIEEILNAWRTDEPNNPSPWWSAYNVAFKLKRYKVASDLLDGVERRTGSTPELLLSRAILANEQWLISDAERLIKNACELAPVDPILLEQKININLKAGNWSYFDKDFSRLCYLLSNKKYEAYGRFFFNINCHPTWDNEQIFHLYQEWGNRVVRHKMLPSIKLTNNLDPQRKLRVGYISPDFRQHAVAKFTLPIIKSHRKDDFEVFAYAHLESGSSDVWTQQFKDSVDNWREIQHWSRDELENAIRKDQIDILVDLAGHTTNNKLSIFLRRVAPIQACHVIGAGQTTGMPCVDYLIATESLWPEDQLKYAVEKVERLAFKGLIFEIPTDAPLPCEIPSLKTGEVIFGVFARPVRVNQRNIRIWSDILKKTPNSILRFEHAPYLEKDIQDRYAHMFNEMGVSSDRIQFRHTRPYWKAFQEIDIQLDPFPAGSGTTVTEGLFMGRMVIAMQDRVAMGRTAHVQLEALGLSDICSANDDQQYVDKACALASDLQLLNRISMSLRNKFINSPIADYDAFSNILGDAYRKWWKSYILSKETI